MRQLFWIRYAQAEMQTSHKCTHVDCRLPPPDLAAIRAKAAEYRARAQALQGPVRALR